MYSEFLCPQLLGALSARISSSVSRAFCLAVFTREPRLCSKVVNDVSNVVSKPRYELGVLFESGPRAASRFRYLRCCISDLDVIGGQPLAHETNAPTCCARVRLTPEATQNRCRKARMCDIRRECRKPLQNRQLVLRLQRLFNDFLGRMIHSVLKWVGFESRP